MGFWLYDLTFLIIAGVIGGLFLLKKKKELKRELGIFILYRTQLGVKFINYVSKKYKKILSSLKYAIIFASYILMLVVLYYFAITVYRYVRYPIFTELVKSPPIMLLLPYFPEIFGVQSFFPPFYFTYFIIAFLIVATVHEFAHGIFMGHNKVRIKSTGVVFIGPLPAGAFVEQNEKDMEKRNKTDQMSILGAGVCSNGLFAVIFLLIWWGLFSITFIPAGATFNSYISNLVNVSSISEIGGLPLDNLTNPKLIEIINESVLTIDLVLDADGNSINLTKIVANGKNYYITPEVLKKQLETGSEYILPYGDFPGIRAGLKGTIIEVDDNKIKTFKDLSEIMRNRKPGEKINVKTNYKGEILEYNFILGEEPNNKSRGVIGIANMEFMSIKKIRIDESVANYFFRTPNTDYKTRSEFLSFLYYLVFWVFGLNLVVAFANMLPFLIFDGGRFFYLTVWGITKSKKMAEKIYKGIGIIILLSLILLMVVWFLRII